MAAASNGYPAPLEKHWLTPGLISSLSGTAGLPPFISFSTSYSRMPNLAPRDSDREGDYVMVHGRYTNPDGSAIFVVFGDKFRR